MAHKLFSVFMNLVVGIVLTGNILIIRLRQEEAKSYTVDKERERDRNNLLRARHSHNNSVQSKIYQLSD